MKYKIILSGIPVELEKPDIDRDGNVGGTETLKKMPIPAKEVTEVGEVLFEMNKDEVNDDRLPSIDFLSRIHPAEMTPMVVYDALIGMGLIPENCGILSRVKMRKSVSEAGKGRDEIVKVVVGKREEEQEGFKNKMKNLVGGGSARTQ